MHRPPLPPRDIPGTHLCTGRLYPQETSLVLIYAPAPFTPRDIPRTHLWTGRLYPPRDIPGTHLCTGRLYPKRHPWYSFIHRPPLPPKRHPWYIFMHLPPLPQATFLLLIYVEVWADLGLQCGRKCSFSNNNIYSDLLMDGLKFVLMWITHMCCGLHVKLTALLFYFKQIWTFSIDFSNTLQHYCSEGG